jgi:hypothetical protein
MTPDKEARKKKLMGLLERYCQIARHLPDSPDGDDVSMAIALEDDQTRASAELVLAELRGGPRRD